MGKPALFDNDWEYSLFRGDKHSSGQKYTLRGLRGLGKSTIVTQAEGVGTADQPLLWTARRHRKGHQAIGSSLQKVEQHQGKAALYLRTRRAIIWGSPMLTGLGSGLFAISNASQISSHVQPWPMQPYIGHHLYDWIGALLAFIGLWLVLPGQVLKWLEVINADFERRVHNWSVGHSPKSQPRLRLLPERATWNQLSFYGVTARVFGAVCFAWAATANFINQTLHVPFRLTEQDWLIYLPYVLAPSAFLVGSLFLVWEANHSWWKGFLPITRRVKYISFWINFFGCWAALGMLSGGICQWNRRKLLRDSGVIAMQLYRAFGYFFGGSLLFLISNVLIITEIAMPELQ